MWCGLVKADMEGNACDVGSGALGGAACADKDAVKVLEEGLRAVGERAICGVEEGGAEKSVVRRKYEEKIRQKLAAEGLSQSDGAVEGAGTEGGEEQEKDSSNTKEGLA